MNKKKVISLLGLIIVVVLWGIAPVVSKYLFDNNIYSPALLVGLRGLLSCIAMVFVIIATGGYKKISKVFWIYFPLFFVILIEQFITLANDRTPLTMIRGVVAVIFLFLVVLLFAKSKKEIIDSYLICVPAGIILGCAYLFQFIGLDTTTPAKNTFLESFSCFAVPLTMFILTKEKPSIPSVGAAVACLFGAFVLCGNGWDFSAIFTSPTIGDILSCVGGIFFGIDIAFTKVFAKHRDPWVYVFIQLIILTAMSFAYSWPFEENIAFSWKWQNLLILLFLGVACTAICWVMRTACIKQVSAVTCAVLMPMSAVVAALTSMIFRMEAFSWNVIVGGLIITIAIVLSGVYDARQEKKELLLKQKEAIIDVQD